jgi:hypothetical protein
VNKRHYSILRTKKDKTKTCGCYNPLTSIFVVSVPNLYIYIKNFIYIIQTESENVGRALAQAVRRWLPTVAARVRVWAACGVCGGQSGTGAGFLRVLRFPLPIIPPISPSS